jgi:hypothetical protein
MYIPDFDFLRDQSPIFDIFGAKSYVQAKFLCLPLIFQSLGVTREVISFFFITFNSCLIVDWTFDGFSTFLTHRFRVWSFRH